MRPTVNALADAADRIRRAASGADRPIRYRKSRRQAYKPVLLGLLAVGTLGATIGSSAFAETGTPRTKATVSIISDSTAPDPTSDGKIQTFDLATYRLNVSQNGANSVGNVFATVTLTNGFFQDSDRITPGIQPPTQCRSGSSLSVNRKTLTCNVGPLSQGSAVALDFAVMASGDVANGDLLSGTVAVTGTAPIPMPTIIIQGTAQVDVTNTFISQSDGTTLGGGYGKFVRFRLDVRTAGATGRGGLPVQTVTLVDNWQDIRTKFPNAVLVTNEDTTQNHGQVVPVGNNRTGYPRGQVSADPTASLNTPEYIIPNSGSWSSSYSGSSDTTVDITVSGFTNEIMANTLFPNQSVASGIFTVFIPQSDIPLGTTTFTNRITNVRATVAGVPGTIPEYDASAASNNASSSTYRIIEAAYRNQWSSYVNPGSNSRDTGDTALKGSWSPYRRPALAPEQLASDGFQRVYAGMPTVAESTSGNSPDRFSIAVFSTLTCMKFQRPITGSGNATATLVGARPGANPPIKLLPNNGISVQYATLPTAGLAGQKCDDRAGVTWSTTKPASYNAVRATARVQSATTPAKNEGRSINLTLQVPVNQPSGVTVGDFNGFYNTSVNGSFLVGGPVNSSSVSGNPIDGEWIGAAGNNEYRIGTHDNPQNGDRVVMGRAISTFDKTVCDTVADETVLVAIGSEVEYCLNGVVEGSGATADVSIVDDSIAAPGSPVQYIVGSGRVTKNGVTTNNVNPVISGGKATWNLGSVNAGPVQVRYKVTSLPGVATPGGSYTNVARIQSPNLPNWSARPSYENPNEDAHSVQFRSGRFDLNISKSTSSPSLVYPDTAIPWNVSLTNTGGFTIGSIDMIDVLPYNGDGAISRVPASAFSGSTGLTGAPTAAGAITYTSRAPGSVSMDPGDASNLPSGSTGWYTAGQFGTPGAPANFAAVTAIRIVNNTDLLPGATRTITIPMRTSGNASGDTYTNDAGARVREGAAGPVLSVQSNDVTVKVASPGLGITKLTQIDPVTSAPQTFFPGRNNTYTINVENTGTLVEPAAVVTDYIRPGLTYVSSSNGGTYNAGTRTVTWPAVSVAAGGTFTRTVVVTVDSPVNPALIDGTGEVPNTASVRGTEACIPPTPDAQCDSTVRNPVANPHLVQNKVVDKAEGVPGDTLTYTVEITNDGDAPATGVVGTDTLPSGVTYSSSVPSKGTVSASGSTLTWNVGSLAVGETVTATVTATIKNGQWDSTLLNRFKASHNPGDCFEDCDPPAVNNQCEDDPTQSCAVTITPMPEWSQSKTVDKAIAEPGDTLTYTVRADNLGPVDVPGFIGRDVLPTSVTFVSASNGGTYNAGTRTVTWPSTPLPQGGFVEFTVTVTVNSGQWSATIINPFKATATEPGFPPPAVEGPCVPAGAIDATYSCAQTVTPTPSWSQNKYVIGSLVTPGDDVTYYVVTTNTGPSAIRNFTGVDTLPVEVNFVSASNGGTYNPVNRTITWPTTNISVGSSIAYEVNVKVSPTAPNGQFINRYQATSTEPGTPPPTVENVCLDNALQSCAPLKVESAPQMNFGKVVDQLSASPGDTLTYTLSASNTGNNSATGVVGTDTLPAGVTYVSSSATNGTISHSAGIITWTIGSMTANQVESATVIVTVNG